MYAGLKSRTTNNGRGVWRCTNPRTSPSWTNTGGGVEGYVVLSLEYDSQRDVLYATGSQSDAKTKSFGVWRCDNPRTSPSWTHIADFIDVAICIAYDVSHDVLYAAGKGVWRCTNPRTSPSWTNTDGGLSSQVVGSLALDPIHDVLYAGISFTPRGVWRCTSPATSPTWTKIQGSQGSNPAGQSGPRGVASSDIVYDTKYDVLYAGTDDFRGVWQCVNPRTNNLWSRVGSGIDSCSVAGFAIDSYHGFLYAGLGDEHNKVLGVWRYATQARSQTEKRCLEGFTTLPET